MARMAQLWPVVGGQLRVVAKRCTLLKLHTLHKERVIFRLLLVWGNTPLPRWARLSPFEGEIALALHLELHTLHAERLGIDHPCPPVQEGI